MSPQVERDEISKLFPENVPIRNSFHIIVIQDPQAQHAFDNSYCIPKLKLNEEVLEIVKQDFELFVTNKYPYLLRALGYPPEMSGNWNTNQIKQFQLLLYRCQYQRAIYGKHGTQFLQLKHAVTYLTGGSDCDLLEKIGDGILGIALHTVTNKHQHGKVLGIIQGNTANDRTSDLATNKILRIIGQIGGVNLFIYSNTTVSGKTLSDFMEATIGAHFKVFGFDSTVQYVVNLYKLTAHELSKQMYIGSDLTKYTATSEKFISCLYGFEGTKTYDIPRVEPSIDRSLQNFVEEDYIDILDLFMVPKYVLASEQEETRLQELLFVAFHHDTYLKELKVPFMQRFGTTAKNLTTYGNKLIPFVLANRAYSQHPQSVIDIITKVEKLVDKTTLEQVCKSVKIDMYLKYRMAKLEPKYRVHAFEAVIGAMFEALDFERTSAIILNLYAKLMDNK
jgi:dsRNA-specific ribonuclease